MTVTPANACNVTGDLNDFDGDECCRDVADSLPTSRVLTMLKCPSGSGRDEFHSVAAWLPKEAHRDASSLRVIIASHQRDASRLRVIIASHRCETAHPCTAPDSL